MVVGDDVSVRGNDEARANGGRAPLPRHAPRPVLEEVAEEVLEGRAVGQHRPGTALDIREHRGGGDVDHRGAQLLCKNGKGRRLRDRRRGQFLRDGRNRGPECQYRDSKADEPSEAPPFWSLPLMATISRRPAYVRPRRELLHDRSSRKGRRSSCPAFPAVIETAGGGHGNT